MKAKSNHFIFFILLLLLSVLLCCKSTAKVQNVDFKEKAEKILGKSLIYNFNEDSSFVLCLKSSKPKPGSPARSIKFAVIKIKDGTIVVQDFIHDGNITWENDHTIEVYDRNGIMDNPKSINSNRYFYDL